MSGFEEDEPILSGSVFSGINVPKRASKDLGSSKVVPLFITELIEEYSCCLLIP